MDHKATLSGLFPPVMTPFKDDQTIDYDAYIFNMEKMNKTKLLGYMPLGSNGEFRSLSDEESLEIIRVTRKCAAPGKVIMAGAGRESAYQTVEFIKRLADVGINYASLLTPHYFASKMTDDALRVYFEYVADGSPVPVLLYCAPKFAADVMITPELMAKLARHPNIVGMKDTSANDIAIYCAAVPENSDFYVLSGSIGKYLKGLKLGAVGGVLSPLNYMPEECYEIESLFRAGKLAEAEKLSAAIIDFNKRAAGKYSVPGVKAAMDIMGYKGGVPRLPLSPLGDKEKADLLAVFRQEGYAK
jgi:4-hydroxy-2-oxoglutarate aldolase